MVDEDPENPFKPEDRGYRGDYGDHEGIATGRNDLGTGPNGIKIQNTNHPPPDEDVLDPGFSDPETNANANRWFVIEKLNTAIKSVNWLSKSFV